MTMTFMAVCAVVKLADYDPKPPALARLNLQKNEEPRLEMKNGKKKTPELRNRSGEPARHPCHSSIPDSTVPSSSPGIFNFPERISFLIR